MINNNRRVSTPATIASRTNRPLALPVAEQVYEIFRNNGFSIDEAIELSRQASHSYRTTTQRLFQFANALTIQISAGLAELTYAPRNYETPRRTLRKSKRREIWKLTNAQARSGEDGKLMNDEDGKQSGLLHQRWIN